MTKPEHYPVKLTKYDVSRILKSAPTLDSSLKRRLSKSESGNVNMSLTEINEVIENLLYEAKHTRSHDQAYDLYALAEDLEDIVCDIRRSEL